MTWADLIDEATRLGFTVELVPYCETPDSPGILGSRAGVCIPSKRLILIRDVLEAEDRVTVLAHELEHARGAGHEIDVGPRPRLNFEQEALPGRSIKRLPFLYHDGGRAEAGFKGEAGDCVTRAVAIATGEPYADVYRALAEGMGRRRGGRRSARDGVYRDVYEPFLLERGFVWTPTMSIGSGCTVHLREGELPDAPALVCSLSRHVTALVDGIIRDIYDPSRGGTRCVYGYYRAPEPQVS